MKVSATDKKIDELARMVANGLKALGKEIKEDFARQRSDVDQMLEEHLGLVRTDYDSLARRVKKLEEKVFRVR